MELGTGNVISWKRVWEVMERIGLLVTAHRLWQVRCFGATTQAADINLSGEDKAVLQMIAQDPSVTQKDMADKLGWKVDRVKYYVNKLKANHVLERVGSSQKGHYTLSILPMRRKYEW